MKRSLVIIALIASLACPLGVFAGEDKLQVQQSSYWAKVVLEENSVTASVLFLPVYMLSIPVRIIDGIVNPVPTSQATVPPAAHRGRYR